MLVWLDLLDCVYFVSFGFVVCFGLGWVSVFFAAFVLLWFVLVLLFVFPLFVVLGFDNLRFNSDDCLHVLLMVCYY